MNRRRMPLAAASQVAGVPARPLVAIVVAIAAFFLSPPSAAQSSIAEAQQLTRDGVEAFDQGRYSEAESLHRRAFAIR